MIQDVVNNPASGIRECIVCDSAEHAQVCIVHNNTGTLRTQMTVKAPQPLSSTKLSHVSLHCLISRFQKIYSDIYEEYSRPPLSYTKVMLSAVKSIGSDKVTHDYILISLYNSHDSLNFAKVVYNALNVSFRHGPPMLFPQMQVVHYLQLYGSS